MNDRETLSALLDGELQDEARLFAMRRLAHDAQWQQAYGRWQLAGDVMRRQRNGLAPAGFAERVQQAVAEEPRSAAVAPVVLPVRAPRRRRQWMGGAIAASVALAAVLVAPPFGDRRAETQVVARPVPAAPAPFAVATERSAPATPPVAASVPQPDLRDTPVRAVAATPARPAAPVPAARARREAPAARVAAVRRATNPSSAASAAVLAAAVDNPFSLAKAQSLESRPWPRASLTGQGSGAFTVGYAGGSDSPAGAPSFYPFEPRPEGEPGGTPAP